MLHKQIYLSEFFKKKIWEKVLGKTCIWRIEFNLIFNEEIKIRTNNEANLYQIL